MPTSQPPLDTLFELLANRRRRYALYYLDQRADAVVTLEELTSQVVDWEQTWDDESEMSADELQQHIRVTLHHHHLPEIADAGLIEYDARSKTVRNWDDPSLMAWAQESHEELPHLRALFCTSVSG